MPDSLSDRHYAIDFVLKHIKVYHKSMLFGYSYGTSFLFYFAENSADKIKEQNLLKKYHENTI